MSKLVTSFAAVISLLLSGCATYESQPAYRETVTTYGAAPIVTYSTPPTYYSTPPAYYVVPAPVYDPVPVHVAPPLYAAPSFGMRVESGPRFRRHSPPLHHQRRLRGGNGAGAQMGGPGWSGSVWSR